MTEINAEQSRSGEGRDLKAMIEAMPRKKRALLVLFYVEGLSLSELAAVFEVPAGTIKSRLFAAREELKLSYERKVS